MAKSIWASMCHDIPDGWRFCAENLQAKHSIHYTELESYLQVFSVWNEKNECLSWDETEEWCSLWGLITVPVLYRGIHDKDKIIKTFEPYKEEHEGYVVRTADSFSYSEFRKYVVKYVRPNHVTTSNHWRHQKIEANLLKS